MGRPRLAECAEESYNRIDAVFGTLDPIGSVHPMSFIDDDRPKKKLAHEIGQDVSLVSEGELEERIALLQSEIDRLRGEVAKRRTSRSAADAVFKP